MGEVPGGHTRGRIGAVIRNKWRIDARLGAGAMATVYSATHRNGNRVALKMLNLDYSRDGAVRARFLREGYVANSVGHPGAVKILDDDVAEDGCVFLVMELLEGESLETRRERLGGKLPLDEVFTVGDQLLDLLAAAHEKGIVHRDIKPQNIFVTHDGQVKVLDFGIARMRWSTGERTGTGLMMGTPDFMAPEQANGQADEIDPRSDLWAVGATLFTLLSGQSVHVASTLREYLLATATQPARSLATVAPDAPSQLVSVVDRALELHKDRRWPDARAMQDALRWTYRALADRASDVSITTVAAPASAPSSPRDQAYEEPTRFEPVPPHLLDTLDAERTVMSPPVDTARVPSSDRPSITMALPPGLNDAFPQLVTQPLTPLNVAQALESRHPDARLGVRSPSGSMITADGPTQPVPVEVLRAGVATAGAPAPHATPTPHVSSTPSLEAQVSDPRRTTVSTRRRGSFGMVALVVLVAALAGLAAYAAGFELRDPRRGAQTMLDPATNDAPPPAMALPPPTRAADAGASAAQTRR